MKGLFLPLVSSSLLKPSLYYKDSMSVDLSTLGVMILNVKIISNTKLKVYPFWPLLHRYILLHIESQSNLVLELWHEQLGPRAVTWNTNSPSCLKMTMSPTRRSCATAKFSQPSESLRPSIFTLQAVSDASDSLAVLRLLFLSKCFKKNQEEEVGRYVGWSENGEVDSPYSNTIIEVVFFLRLCNYVSKLTQITIITKRQENTFFFFETRI